MSQTIHSLPIKNLLLKRILLLPASITLSLLLLSCCGCSKKEDPKLKQSFNHAKKVLQEINSSELAQMSFREIMDQGGSIVTYVTASIGPADKFLKFSDSGPIQANTVRLSSDSTDAALILIEAYGSDTKKPEFSERIRIELEE